LKEGLVAGVVAIFLGMLAILIGWTIIGGLGLGIPALLLAMRSYHKGHRLLGVFGIIFSCVGIIEGLAIAGIVGFFSILTMPTSAPTITTTETIKSEHQIYKWRLLWEKRLNNTAYELKVSPNGNFVSVIAGRQLLVFSRDGNISYNVDDGITVGTKLVSISDEGENWILGSRFQKGSTELAIVKNGKAIWVVDLWKILTFPAHVSSIAISQDGEYVVALDGGWIHFSRRENNSLVILWKFKPIETPLKIAISGDNKYICISGIKWVALLDKQGKLIWEKDFSLYGAQWSPPYFISNSNLIGISSGTNDLVLIIDLEGQLIRKIRLKDDVKFPVVVNNLIIGVTRINRTEVLRVYGWEGKPIYTFKPKGNNIFAIASSLDGKYIAVSDNALRVYLLERED
jgi:DNA-binding beta-propeller fold protein YncE